jgi:hypothetical protein
MRNLLPCLAVLAACSAGDTNTPPDVYCTASIEPGLMVYVVDDVTGIPQAQGAVALAIDGDYSDSLRAGVLWGDTLVALQGAAERPGLYQIRVAKPGYRTWTERNVRVFAGACHVRTAQVTARLQPLAP